MEMHDLCAAAIRETSCVLATAVKVEGHAYRKQGVSMLLTERGDMFGSISPGCLESDLQARVGHVLETGKLEWVEYDMRPEEDWSWGETIGCGGFVLVLLEPVHEELRSVMHEMYACLEEGIAVELLRRFHADYSRTEYVLKRRNGILGHMEIPSTNLAALHAGKESEKEETVGGTERMNPDKAEETEALSNSAMAAEQRWNMPRCLSSVHSPKPRLVIVGAGNDAIPVAGLAGASGFRVVVADWRESLCNAKRFPQAERVLGFPNEIMPVLQIRSGDYVILMSHQFPREREFLELLAACEYRYLGILGSKTRTVRLLKGLPMLPNLHAPVGLSIGADGPQEIAVSIVAELIADRRAVSARKPTAGGGGACETDRDRARGRSEQPTGA
ncbi:MULTISPECIES: XdhC family protein [Paenibacillus]|uniref:XdhC family protein n=1 Tax=Paenibacillus TaxID=44249 RepID=UPI0030DA602F